MAALKSKLQNKLRILLIAGVIILLMGTVFVSLFFSFEEATLSSISTNQIKIVESVENNAKIVSEILISQALQLFYSNDVSKLRTAEQLSNYEVINGIRSLNALVTVNSFIDSVYVYNGFQEYIYSTTDSSGGFSSTSENIFRDREAVDLFLEHDDKRIGVPVFRTLLNTRTNMYYDFFSYILMDPDWKSGLMINVTAKTYMNTLQINNSDSFLLDRTSMLPIAVSEERAAELKNQVVSFLPEDISEPGFIIIPAKSSILDVFSADRIICFYTPIKNNNWIYVTIQDYAQTMGGMIFLQRAVYVILGILSLFLIVVAVFLLVKIISPFNRLKKVLESDEIKLLQTNSAVDIDQITEKLKALVQSSENEVHLKKSLQDMVKNEILYNIIIGSEARPREMIADNAFSIEPEQQVFPILVNTINRDSCLSIASQCGITRIEGAIIDQNLILVFQPDPEVELLDFYKKLNTRRTTTKNYVVVGKECFIEDLPTQYHSLHDAFARRILNSDKWIISTDILSGLSADSSDSRELVKQIVALTKKGNSTGSISKLNEFFKLQNTKIMTTVFSSYLNLFQSIKGIETEQDSNENDVDSFNKELRETRDIRKIQGIIVSLHNHVLSSIVSVKANTRKNLMSTIDEIIEREYANQQLSSQFIADSCSISCVYLCRIWRQNTGSSLASRINNVRVDHASEMLKTTNLTIAEISERTGFSNQQYFYTLFKKTTGKTPDEFRKT